MKLHRKGLNMKIFCSVFSHIQTECWGVCRSLSNICDGAFLMELLAVIYYCKKVPSYLVDRVLNILLEYINVGDLPLNLHILFKHEKSIRSQMFLKISVRRNFAIFTGNQLFWSLFLIKLKKIIKKRFNTGVFRSSLIYNTSARHERHEYDTSDTNATRVRH